MCVLTCDQDLQIYGEFDVVEKRAMGSETIMAWSLALMYYLQIFTESLFSRVSHVKHIKIQRNCLSNTLIEMPCSKHYY